MKKSMDNLYALLFFLSLISLNRFQKHIKDCYQALHIDNMNELCFLSTKGKPYSAQ